MVLALASKVQTLALWCLEANVYSLGLGTYGLGVGLKGPSLGLVVRALRPMFIVLASGPMVL